MEQQQRADLQVQQAQLAQLARQQIVQRGGSFLPASLTSAGSLTRSVSSSLLAALPVTAEVLKALVDGWKQSDKDNLYVITLATVRLQVAPPAKAFSKPAILYEAFSYVNQVSLDYKQAQSRMSMLLTREGLRSEDHDIKVAAGRLKDGKGDLKSAQVRTMCVALIRRAAPQSAVPEGLLDDDKINSNIRSTTYPARLLHLLLLTSLFPAHPPHADLPRALPILQHVLNTGPGLHFPALLNTCLDNGLIF